MTVRKYLPANITTETECGRKLVIKRGHGRFMVVRHKAGTNNTPLRLGERVKLRGEDGEKFVLEVIGSTKNDIKMRILGSTGKSARKEKKKKEKKKKEKNNEQEKDK